MNTRANNIRIREPSEDSENSYKAFHAELFESQSIEMLKTNVLRIIKRLGFTDFQFTRLEREWIAGSRRGLMHSYPDELIRVYQEHKLYEIDLLVPYGKENTQAIFSSEIYDYIDDAPFSMPLTKNNRLLVQLYRRFGLFEHFVIPMPACNGNGSVQLLLSHKDMEKEEFRSTFMPLAAQCQALCKAIDAICSTRFRREFIDKDDKPIKISRKPLEILRQLAYNDISITCLSSDLSISPITAHQHVAAARQALSAKTNIGAVMKAIKLGLIRIS